MKVLLKYGFIFEPAETWTQVNQFEQMMSGYFDKLGLKAELIRSQGDDNGMRIIFLTPTNLPPKTDKVNAHEIDKERMKNNG